MELDDGFVAFSGNIFDTGLVTDTLGGVGVGEFLFKPKALLLAFGTKPDVESPDEAYESLGKTDCDADLETGDAALGA